MSVPEASRAHLNFPASPRAQPRVHGELRVPPRVMIVLLTLLCLHMTTRVAAQDHDHDVAFEQGLDALYEGRLQEALNAFQDSLRIAPQPITWLKLGITYLRLEQPHAAYLALNSFLTHADPVLDAADMTFAQSEIARLRAMSTVLVLELYPQNAEVHVDGQAISPHHGELLLTPGSHHMAVSAPGHAQNSQTHNLPAGRFLYTLRLQPAQNAAVQAAPLQAMPPAIDASAAGTETSTSSPHPPSKPATASRPANQQNPCILEPSCIGLVASLGAPNALGLGALLRLDDHLAFDLDAHLLPTVDMSGTKASTQLYLASVLVHPFANGWFATAGLGLQRLLARAERPAAVVHAKVNVPVMAFGLGYLGRSGLIVGIDLSLLVPLQPTRLTLVNRPKSEKEAALYERLTQEANDALDNLRHLLPFMFQLNLLRVGYLF